MPILASHSEPTVDSIPKGFKLPTTDKGSFEIKPSYISLVERNMFGGRAEEDPAKHMGKFVTYCCSIPLTAGVTQHQVKETLFPFSLSDDAAEWLRDLDMETDAVTNCTSLALAFYERGSKRGSGSDNAIAEQLEALTAQIADLKTTQSLGKQETVHMIQQEVFCERCEIDGHTTANCMSTIEQVHAFQSFRQGTPYSNFFPERSQNAFAQTLPQGAYIIPP
ncbi:uncharacterized protein LOC141651501 [Silene latifolia]|uniref:uncharacterized protein LOC141651501 n=1 Tax=Silene latifolia TaxID=37657 RepID=UPI003D77E7C4